MPVLKDILKESREHYRQLEVRIGRRLRELPMGSVLKRRIGGNDYYYLKVRQGNRVISKYLGKKAPQEIEKAVQERRQLKRQLREVRESLRLLRRMHGRKRHV